MSEGSSSTESPSLCGSTSRSSSWQRVSWPSSLLEDGELTRSSRLRILAGAFKGRRLQVPGNIRPTEAQVREALFSIFGDRVVGCTFLDLFAGSGAVGLEALSRGADRVFFIDSLPRSIASIRHNVNELAAQAPAQIRRLDLPRGLSRLEQSFEIIFADPPYSFAQQDDLLRAAEGHLESDGELVLEHSARCEPSHQVGRLERFDRRAYGESCLSFYRM